MVTSDYVADVAYRRVHLMFDHKRHEELNPCPEALRVPLLKLLRWSILDMRFYCTNSKAVFAHSDHVHNIPDLLVNFKPELLSYYWETERVCFLRNLPDDAPLNEAWHAIWVDIEREYLWLCGPSSTNVSQD